jgi:hypothetical protein
VTDVRWLVVARQGGAYGTVWAPTGSWFLARALAGVKFGETPQALVLRKLGPELTSPDVADEEIFHWFGVKPVRREIIIVRPNEFARQILREQMGMKAKPRQKPKKRKRRRT